MPKTEFCPYLGMEDDSSTPILFPSASNRCFRTEKGIQLEADYQSICCLTREYRQCPVFLDASRTDLLPAQQIQAAERNLRRLNVIFFSLLLLFIFGVVVLGVNLGLIPNVPFLKLDVPVPLITTQTFDPNTGSGERDLLFKSSPTPHIESHRHPVGHVHSAFANTPSGHGYPHQDGSTPDGNPRSGREGQVGYPLWWGAKIRHPPGGRGGKHFPVCHAAFIFG